MREVIKTAKTVEEATELACAELGASEADVTVEIIDLPQKKLFKTIPAKVRVMLEEEEPAAPVAAPAAVETKPVAPVAEKPAAPATEKPAAPKPAVLVEEELPETAVSEANKSKAAAAVAYLQEVASKMGATAITVEPVQRGEALILKVNGDDAGALIGHRGEVMESLSYLCGLVANREGGDYTRVNLDVNNYRSKREANLIALARRIGAKVAKTGRAHTLEPMNPYERRIIHSAIGEIEGVQSESTGEGANRRVVISSTNPRAPRSNDRGSDRGGYRGNRNGGRGGFNKGSDRGGFKGDRGPRRESSTPTREYADRPRDTEAAPSVPTRTEKVNDGANLPLYGKIDL